MVLQEDKIGQTFLLPLDLNDLIPQDHICHYVKKLVDCYDFSDIHAKFIGTAGGKAYSRKILLRLILLATIEGYKSSRDIEKQARLNIPYMWICGFDKPTYRTILNFKNDHEDLIKDMLVIILVDAKKEGLVKLGVIALDGSTIKANASNKNTVTEELLELAQQLIDESIIQDKDDDEKYGEDEVGEEVSPKLTLKMKIKELVMASQEKKDIGEIKANELDLNFKFTTKEVKQIDKAYKEVDIVKKQRARSKDPKLKDKHIIISLNDPYSRFMKNKKGKFELSYNILNFVDCDSGFILNSSLTQDPTDHYQLIPQIENLGQNPDINIENSKILADTAFNTQEGIQYLYENDLDGYIPNKKQASENKNKKFLKYAKANFIYNYEKNHYICPQDHILPYKNTYNGNNKIKKVYYTNECKNCPAKYKCSQKSNYRIITHYDTEFQDLMAQKMEIHENKEIYKKRANCERPFAYLKHTLEWTTMRSKDEIKNQTDLNLITLAHNIKLTHNHKIKKNQQQNKKNTPKTKTKNNPRKSNPQNSMQKPICT